MSALITFPIFAGISLAYLIYVIRFYRRSDQCSIDCEAERTIAWHADNKYRYVDHSRGEGGAPFSLIEIDCPIPCMFHVRKRSVLEQQLFWVSQLFKRVGWFPNTDTGNDTFDRIYYIESDDMLTAHACCSLPNARQAVHSLFALGYTSVQGSGFSISAYCGTMIKRNSESRIKAVKRLMQLSAAIRTIRSRPTPKKSHLLQTLFFVTVAMELFLLLLSNALLIIEPGPYYRYSQFNEVLLASFLLSIPILLIYLILISRLLASMVNARLLWLVRTLMLLFTIPITGFYVFTSLNANLDSQANVPHLMMVREKHVEHNVFSPNDYYLIVDSWQKSGGSEKVVVDSNFYRGLTENESMIDLRIKPGKFGYQWVESYVYLGYQY